MPVAYYAVDAAPVTPKSASREFWWKTVTVGPWPSGPAWFVWVLLALDVIAALMYRHSARMPRSDRPAVAGELCAAGIVFLGAADRIDRRLRPVGALFRRRRAGSRSGRSRSRPAASGSICCISLPAPASAPCRSTRACSPPTAGWRGAGRCGSRRPSHSIGCLVGLIYIKHSVLPDIDQQPLWWETAYALAFVVPTARRRPSTSWRCSCASTMTDRACSIRCATAPTAST